MLFKLNFNVLNYVDINYFLFKVDINYLEHGYILELLNILIVKIINFFDKKGGQRPIVKIIIINITWQINEHCIEILLWMIPDTLSYLF